MARVYSPRGYDPTMSAGATVRPFRALRFDSSRVALADVVAPPFDVITPEQHAALAARSPYNAVHLILPGEGGEEGAHDLMCRWRAERVLVLDEAPGYSWLRQDYTAPDGARRTRGGFIGLVRIEPYETRVILPHERYHLQPVLNRLELLRATRAQLSPIFGVYHDPDRRAAEALSVACAEPPLVDATDDDGTRHRLWRVPGDHPGIATALAASTILIADGHHRYETALRYFEERGSCSDDPAAWMMMYLANAEDGDLTIYPTHRVVTGVAPAVTATLEDLIRRAGLEVHEVDDAVAGLDAADGAGAFVVARPGGRPLLALAAERETDAAVAQEALLGPLLGGDAATLNHRVRYVHRAADALAAVGDDRIAILLRPPSIADVEGAALRAETLPQKSTYFFPKMLDGMLFHALDDCL
jgi:uncharacterized protein (DUF1015 family)